jgi:hypothetical protein
MSTRGYTRARSPKPSAPSMYAGRNHHEVKYLMLPAIDVVAAFMYTILESTLNPESLK